MTIYEVLNEYAKRKTASEPLQPQTDYGNAALKTAYDPIVDVWRAYYRGEVRDIHNDIGWNGEREYPIVRKSMKVPKIIAQKWASTLFSEAFKITLKNEVETAKFDAVARRLNFRAKLTEAAIWAYAEGTSALIAGADITREIMEDGSERVTTGGKLKLDVVKYANMYPFDFTKDSVSGIAFAKEERRGDETIFIINIHSEKEGKYLIENVRAVVKNALPGMKEVIDFQGIEKVYAASEFENPAFCVIKPNTVNDYTNLLPFGQSIFADALAACDDIDLAAAGLRRDIKEGDQVTFIGKDLLLMKTVDGEKKRYFDNRAGRFFTINQMIEAGTSEKRIFEKYVPEIRFTQFIESLRSSLNWATMASGLGKGMLDQQVMATATQVVHSEAEKMQNKSLHQRYLENEIVKIVRALCELSGITGAAIDAETVNIVWEDSVIVDTETEKQFALREIEAGVSSKEEYRQRFFGETPEEAAEKIAAIAARKKTEQSPDFDFMEYEGQTQIE
jgi:A118 family predicted phage portal protein